MSALEITFPLDGELVNHHHSIKAGPGFLMIPVKGTAEPGAEVKVNGCSGKADENGHFSIPVKFDKIFMELEAVSGMQIIHSRAVCDFDSSKRYNFYIDDNVYFFTEIVRKQHKSIFDSFYLNFLREMHRKYGVKFTLNAFAFDDAHQFDVKDFPAKYKPEFQDNADWLKFAFHAQSEFPDAPYCEAFPEKLPEHYELVTDHIRRFAGESSLIEPVIMHWYEITNAASRHFIADRGMNVFTKAADFWEAKEKELGRMPLALYNYEFKQLEIPLVFNCNFFPAVKLLNILEMQYLRSDRDFLNIGTHEQYSYPEYSNYMPDHFQRIDSVLKSLTDHGYQPVYFTENLLAGASGRTDL